MDNGNEILLNRMYVVDVPYFIGELLFNSVGNQFIFSSIRPVVEDTRLFQIYSIDLKNDLIERWGKNFQGNIHTYTIQLNGGLFILGQLGINIQIYSQLSPENETIVHNGSDGSYLLISSSINSIVFAFSSFSKAEEIYFVKDLNQLKSAQMLTNENNHFNEYNLPESKSYKWINNEDNETIEGILHYSPGKFEEKNLPVLVLLHGGPLTANLNYFFGDWYNWAPMGVAEGWLVFEPNYRGSTGYGDKFANQIRYELLTRPGKDILFDIDHLIEDGIGDPTKLAIGGYSYGGILTNWLITQTTRSNAALSGARSIEQVSFWGMQDTPIYLSYLLGGFPWEIPQTYQNQSAIYYLHRIRTLTHIVSGTDAIRVPLSFISIAIVS